MHAIKAMYAKQVMRLVESDCRKMVGNTTQPVELALQIKHQDAYTMIKKLFIALPDPYFYNLNSTLADDLLLFISRNYLLFEAQEDFESEAYTNHFINFIYVLSEDIRARYFQ